MKNLFQMINEARQLAAKIEKIKVSPSLFAKISAEAKDIPLEYYKDAPIQSIYGVQIEVDIELPEDTFKIIWVDQDQA